MGTLAFPKLEDAEYYGYHKDSLQVTRMGTAKICGPKSTSWGCNHKGNAEIKNYEYYTGGVSTSESATIVDANGYTYRFKLQHEFDYYETYYDEDHKLVGTLSISLNNKVLGNFSHPKNGDQDTHNDDGSLNGAYKGIIFVDVTCNRGCKCVAKKVTPTCPVVAEMKFPNIDGGNFGRVASYGYHNDFVVARKRGEEEYCAPDSPSTNWCTHQGDAYIYNIKDADEIDKLEAEHVVIPEAAGGNFEFKIEHYYTYKELYYDTDHEMAGKFTIWIDGVNKGTYSHEVSQNVDTHIDNDPDKVNPEYKGKKYVYVECTNACDCTIKTQEEPQCEIRAKMEFPKEADVEFLGHHSDSVIVEKIGEEEQCESTNKAETEWGCKHNGKIAQISNWKDGDGDFSRGFENARISDGLDGNFRFRLQHNYNEEEQRDGYTDDHKMSGTMTLSINNIIRGTFAHPDNNKQDTHKPNGTINSKYKGMRYVDVKCNSECDCEVQDHLPKCEINAELSFENFGNDYGYHADYLSVWKDDIDEVCNYANTMSSWGCIHKGDAYASKNTDEDIEENATVYIPNGLNSKFEFYVRHYSSVYDTYYEDDYKKPGELTISINGNVSGPFSHPKAEKDGGVVTVIVQCSSKCDCVVTKDTNGTIRQDPDGKP